MAFHFFDIRQRYREIGIRKINGAGMCDLYQLLFRKYILVLAVAFIIAAPLTYYIIYLYTQDFAVKVIRRYRNICYIVTDSGFHLTGNIILANTQGCEDKSGRSNQSGINKIKI